MRIANATLVSEMLRNITTNRGEVNYKYIQISNGKKFQKRSDNPVQTYEIANIESRNHQSDQWATNISRASSWEMASEARLNNMIRTMQRVKELTVQSNAGTLTGPDLKNIGIEINQVIDSLVTELNSSFAGTPMFAGAGLRPDGQTGHWNQATQGLPPQPGDPNMPPLGGNSWENLTQAEYNTWVAAQPPGSYNPGWIEPTGRTFEISYDAQGDITGVTYNGSLNRREIQVSNFRATTAYGASGEELINYQSIDRNSLDNAAVQDLGAGLVRIFSSGHGFLPGDTINVRGTVNYNGEHTVAAVGDGYFDIAAPFVAETTPDTASVSGQVEVNLFDTLIRIKDDLMAGRIPTDTMIRRTDVGLDNIIGNVVNNGVSQNKLRLLSRNVEISQESGNDWLSKLGDLDVAEAITQLNEMEAALQASLQMVPRMNSLRFIDFI